MPVFEASSRPAVQAPLPGQRARKGKEKAAEVIVLDSDEEDGKAAQVGDDRLWVDMYEPQTEEELAVHVKKVKDVRQWLTEAFESDRQRKYRVCGYSSGPSCKLCLNVSTADTRSHRPSRDSEDCNLACAV